MVESLPSPSANVTTEAEPVVSTSAYSLWSLAVLGGLAVALVLWKRHSSDVPFQDRVIREAPRTTERGDERACTPFSQTLP
jgi:hypothetical protein